MRGVKVILALFAAIIVVAAVLVVLRKPIAGFAVRQAMASQGLPSPKARVSELSINHIRIEELSSASPNAPGGRLLQLDHVDIAFDLGDALSARRVQSIDVGPGVVRIDIDDDNKVQVAGVSIPVDREQSGGGLPFDTFSASRLTIDIHAPDGIATGNVDANYDINGAGRIEATLNTDRLGFYGLVAEGASASLNISLNDDGNANWQARLTGDIRSPYGQIRDADMAIDGEGASWKRAAQGDWGAFQGAAAVSIRDSQLETENAPFADTVNRYGAMLGGPFRTLTLSGDLDINVAEGAITIDAGEQALSVADKDMRISIDAAMGEPLVAWSDDGAALGGVLSVRGGELSAMSTFDAQQSGDGWLFNAPISVSALETSAFAMSDASAIIRGEFVGGGIDFDVTARGEILSAAIGRFSISDAPGAVHVNGRFDSAAKSIVLHLPEGNCAALDQLSFSIGGQDMDASLRGARLCANDAPLARIQFDGDPVTDFSGAVRAQRGRYRLGQTRFVGTPPSFNIGGRYVPSENRTTASGEARGGSVVMNDLLRFDRAAAGLDFALEKSEMTIKVDASQIRMTEYGETAKVAPIFASGTMVLADDVARFEYEAFSENNAALGEGVGAHNIKSATGDAVFTFNRLEFAPGGLQPDVLAPVLKGIIGLTQGAADGVARFTWAPGGIGSAANISFDNLTFRGPGLTVTRTAGVNGDISFSSLWPVATDGAQSVTVGGVDFGALQLENGEIVFDMPGDDTLLVERAIFPWFGGQIGVRDARATFTGGNALAALRVETVDLKQVLEFVDVDGLSGEGALNGELPLVIENSRASFVDGRLSADGPGRISYVGKAGAAAAEAGGDAQIAFDVLRDLRYEKLSVLIDGPLDGRLAFRINFEGTGEVSLSGAQGRVPVKYNINLDAALLDLLNQANLSRNLELQIQNAVEGSQ